MNGSVTCNPDKGLFQRAKLVLPPHPLPAPCIEPPRADCPFYRIRKLSDRHTTANPIPELLLTAWIPAPAPNSFPGRYASSVIESEILQISRVKLSHLPAQKRDALRAKAGFNLEVHYSLLLLWRSGKAPPCNSGNRIHRLGVPARGPARIA